jgi:hypothetical protein
LLTAKDIGLAETTRVNALMAHPTTASATPHGKFCEEIIGRLLGGAVDETEMDEIYGHRARIR